MVGALLACLVLLAVGCHARHEPQPFPDAERRGEDGLRQMGQGMFEVLTFRGEDGDGQASRYAVQHDMSLYRLRFTTQIRYLRDVWVPSQEETREHLRQPDSTAKDIEQDIVWRRLLGAGAHARGSTQTLGSVAVFEEMESGWRLVAIDGPDLEE